MTFKPSSNRSMRVVTFLKRWPGLPEDLSKFNAQVPNQGAGVCASPEAAKKQPSDTQSSFRTNELYAMDFQPGNVLAFGIISGSIRSVICTLIVEQRSSCRWL